MATSGSTPKDLDTILEGFNEVIDETVGVMQMELGEEYSLPDELSDVDGIEKDGDRVTIYPQEYNEGGIGLPKLTRRQVLLAGGGSAAGILSLGTGEGRGLLETAYNAVTGIFSNESQAFANNSTVNETPTREDIRPEHGTEVNHTGTPVEEGTPVNMGKDEDPEDRDLTGTEHYFQWIHGENEQIREAVQGTEKNTSISFKAINNALEEGMEEGGRNHAIANALETASEQYTPSTDETYENRHTHILSAIHQRLEDKNGEQWDFQLFSMADWGKSTAFPSDGIDYSKIWVQKENKEDEYTDINAALAEQYQHTTHIEGQETNNQYEEVLQMLRDPERFGTKPAHDYEDLENRLEYDRENLGRDYSDEGLEEAFGSWVEKFSNYIMGDGMAAPSSVDEWREFHEGMEAGPNMFLGLNEAYHNEGYDGEPAQFTVEDEIDGSVSMNDTPDGYNPEEDGVPGNPAA